MAAKTEPFEETQYLPRRRTALVLAAPPCFMLGLVFWQVVLGHPWGREPMSNGRVIGWTIFLWLVYARLLTVSLVTEVRGGELALKLKGLWRVRRIPLSSIRSVETIVVDPLRDYGGYGIRSTRWGKAYVAGSTEAVRLTLAGDEEIVVGSRRAKELAAALHELR